MLDTEEFGQKLKEAGFDFYSGVPCSFLKNLINYAVNECEYVTAPNEGDAIAICTGAYTGGRKSVALMQNSGLTNAVSPLTSLNFPFRLPVLGFVSLRGEEGIGDEPQHELMGRITTDLLDLMEIEWEFLSSSMNEAEEQIRRADKNTEDNKSFFFVVKKGTFSPVALKPAPAIKRENRALAGKSRDDALPSRYSALAALNTLKESNTVHLLTTGKTGRELYEIEDSPNNFYMVGSMGCIGGFGLGLSLAKPKKDVIVVDGDGSLLMRMGIMSTIGISSPQNMLHIVLDNESYDSTGGQGTLSGNVDFAEIAKSCGYTSVLHAHDLDEFSGYIKNWKKRKELTFIFMKIAGGSMKNLGRPKERPYEVKERLMRFIGR